MNNSVSSIFIKYCYCLNLPSYNDRKNNMIKQLQKFSPIIPYKFINGVQPGDKTFNNIIKSKDKVDTTATQPRCYCIKKCTHNRKKLRPTEIAISLSHLKIYKQAYLEKYQWILVCEDDTIFIDNFLEILNKTIPETVINTEDPTIIFLGRPDNPGLKISDPTRFKLKEAPIGLYSNYAYIVNYPGLKILIKKFFPIWKPEDGYKRLLVCQEKIKGWQIRPSPVAELSSGINAKSQYTRLSKLFTLPKGNNNDNNKTDKNITKKQNKVKATGRKKINIKY